MLPEDVRPQTGWALCRALTPMQTTVGGLHLALDLDKNVKGEGVAEVVAISTTTWATKAHKAQVPHGIPVGARVLYRGFLRFAQQFGDLFDTKGCEYFLLSIDDIQALLEGEGSLGAYGEFRT